MNGGTHPLRGIALLCLALVFFAGTDTMIKLMTALCPAVFVVAVRYLVNAAAILVLCLPSRGMALFRTQRTGLVLVRSGCLAFASLFVALALKRLPVAEATAVFFLSPMLVILTAGFFLGERAGANGIVAALGGFAGIVLIARPGGGLDGAGVAYALVAMLCLAAYQLLSRVLVRSESTVTLLFYASACGGVLFAAAVPLVTPIPGLGFGDWLMLFVMGLTGGIGHYFFTSAYHHADATVLAPVNYLQLVLAVLFGWLVFGHIPDALSLAGMLIVALSGAGVAWRARLIEPADAN